MAATVLVNKQSIRINTDDAELGHYLRKKLNGELQEMLIMALERIFIQNNNAGDSLHIPKIQVDLGAMTLSEFEQQYIPKVEAKLREALQELFDNKQSAFAGRSGTVFGASQTDRKEPAYELLSPKQQTLIAVFFYLEHGILPWWYRHDDSLNVSDLLHDILEKQPEKVILKFLMMRTGDEQAKIPLLLNRLFQYLSNQQGELLIHLTLEQINEPALTRNVLSLLQNRSEIHKLIHFNTFHQTLLESLLVADHDIKASFIYSFLKKGIPHPHEKPFRFTNHTEYGQLSHLIQKALEDVVRKGWSTGKDGEVTGEKKAAKAKPLAISEETALSEGLFITNAGVILLHPFLTTLFDRTALLDSERQFNSIESQHRAAIMLHYLHSGDTDYQEWNLAFDKVLVGIPLQEIIPPRIVLSPDEKQHCDDLLTAVVQHWNALKGASVAAVQQTFLMRNGKLIFKDKALTLFVERTATDILLERLPWGFSTVKLPWLTNMIFTTW